MGEGGGVECISVGRLEEGEGQQGESVCSRWRITMFATTATQCEDEFLVFLSQEASQRERADELEKEVEALRAKLSSAEEGARELAEAAAKAGEVEPLRAAVSDAHACTHIRVRACSHAQTHKHSHGETSHVGRRTCTRATGAQAGTGKTAHIHISEKLLIRTCTLATRLHATGGRGGRAAGVCGRLAAASVVVGVQEGGGGGQTVRGGPQLTD